MSQVSKSVKLLYCEGEQLTVGTIQRFARELDHVDIDDELEVRIESNGRAFTIEGFVGEV